jgi:hypothetical protein
MYQLLVGSTQLMSATERANIKFCVLLQKSPSETLGMVQV